MRQIPWTKERLFSQATAMPNGCIEWTGYRDTAGYGQVNRNRKLDRTHRVSWILHHGQEIPDGMAIRHRCDNPPCVNPDHLVIGTFFDNMVDARERGRLRGKAKINRKTADEIKSLAGTMKQKDIASRLGVSEWLVSNIILGHSWSTVPKANRPPRTPRLSADVIQEMRRRYDSGEGITSIAIGAPVGRRQVFQICKRRGWNSVPHG